MTRGTRIRIAAFLVLSAVGIVYITGTYLGVVDRLLGRGITVQATLPGRLTQFTAGFLSSAVQCNTGQHQVRKWFSLSNLANISGLLRSYFTAGNLIWESFESLQSMH